MLIQIEPLGTEIFLPAIVLGWETDVAEEEAIIRQGDAPPWFLMLAQQAGGLAMSYPNCVGMVLRWHANTDRFLSEADWLIRGFKLMAEDSDLATLERDYPCLRSMVSTFGDPYRPQELTRLDHYLSQHVFLPQFESGLEAFLRMSPCDLFPYFAGWRALRCTLRDEDSRGGSCYGMNEGLVYYIGDRNRHDVFQTDDHRIDEASLGKLAEYGRQVGLTRPMRAFLLWENSD